MFALTCPACHAQSLLAVDAAAERLRELGSLRRNAEPDEQLVAVLLAERGDELTCPLCGGRGVRVAPADVAADDEDVWQTAVLCEICRVPIPPERLEILPDTRRCMRCQDDLEAGRAGAEELEYCPRCGALVEIRLSRGSGITRYRRFCTGEPPCRLGR